MHKLVVFDFDHTLAAINVSNWVDRGSMVNVGFGGAHRVAMLADLLNTLSAQGVKLAICSLNTRDVIRVALDATGLLRFFGSPPVICDCDDFFRCGQRKSSVIIQALLPAIGVSSEREADLCFVDDDPANIVDVRTHLPSATALLVPRNQATLAQAVAGRTADAAKSGMGVAESEAILEWAFQGRPRPTRAPPSAEPGPVRPGHCTSFRPKRMNGPLARRCANCGAHEHDHVSSGGS